MKVKCPKCKRIVPADRMNISTDLALCPQCNEGFKISESLAIDSVNADILQNPPKGAWFKQETHHVVVGATTRSPQAFFLVPFTCVWSGGSLGGIYGSQIVEGQFDLHMSLFGIIFLLGSIILWTSTLMAMFGKIEVFIGETSSVFVGIGPVGWTRQFDWSTVQTIREYGSAIVLEGKTCLEFNSETLGMELNEERRRFVLNVLRYLKANLYGTKI